MSAAYLNGQPRLEHSVIDLDADRKAFENLRAGCAFRGYSLARSNPNDGPVTYWASRWGLCTSEMRTLSEVAAFVQKIGGQTA